MTASNDNIDSVKNIIDKILDNDFFKDIHGIIINNYISYIDDKHIDKINRYKELEYITEVKNDLKSYLEAGKELLADGSRYKDIYYDVDMFLKDISKHCTGNKINYKKDNGKTVAEIIISFSENKCYSVRYIENRLNILRAVKKIFTNKYLTDETRAIITKYEYIMNDDIDYSEDELNNDSDYDNSDDD
jgi:hypothetical protein